MDKRSKTAMNLRNPLRRPGPWLCLLLTVALGEFGLARFGLEWRILGVAIVAATVTLSASAAMNWSVLGAALGATLGFCLVDWIVLRVWGVAWPSIGEIRQSVAYGLGLQLLVGGLAILDAKHRWLARRAAELSGGQVHAH